MRSSCCPAWCSWGSGRWRRGGSTLRGALYVVLVLRAWGFLVHPVRSVRAWRLRGAAMAAAGEGVQLRRRGDAAGRLTSSPRGWTIGPHTSPRRAAGEPTGEGLRGGDAALRSVLRRLWPIGRLRVRAGGVTLCPQCRQDAQAGGGGEGGRMYTRGKRHGTLTGRSQVPARSAGRSALVRPDADHRRSERVP
jgi:hypothetical protein